MPFLPSLKSKNRKKRGEYFSTCYLFLNWIILIVKNKPSRDSEINAVLVNSCRQFRLQLLFYRFSEGDSNDARIARQSEYFFQLIDGIRLDSIPSSVKHDCYAKILFSLTRFEVIFVVMVISNAIGFESKTLIDSSIQELSKANKRILLNADILHHVQSNQAQLILLSSSLESDYLRDQVPISENRDVS